MPFIGAAGELKTKPTQHSVRDLRSIGIQPDILLCRTDRFLDQDIKRKIALFCDVDEEAVITAKDVVEHLRSAARARRPKGSIASSSKRLHLPQTEARMDAWEDLVDRIKNPTDEITIHVVGKYVGYEDSYKSLNEALYHGGFKHRLRVNIHWVEAEALEQPGGEQLLDGADGILVPGGFGDRGTRGMMRAAEIARERGIPYFGICYGFQWATVEYARNVCGLADADSTECAPDTPHKVIYKLRDLLGVDDLGGTMRLGTLRVRAEAGLASRSSSTAQTLIHERHRHRYEFNCLYEQALDRQRAARSRADRPTASSSRSSSCPSHPWYVAVQFHPEFKSKPLKPHPLFAGFVEASHQHKLAGAASTPARASVVGVGGVHADSDSAGARRSAAARPLLLIAARASSRARRTPSRPGARRSATSPRAPACRSSSRRRTTRRTARPARSFRGPGLDEGLRVLGARARRRRRADPDRHPRAGAGRAGRRGRRRAADSRVPLAADRSARRRRADRARRQHQEGPVPRARRHAPRDRQGHRRRQPAACSSPSAASASATTTSSSTCARFRCMRALGYPVVFDVTHSLQLPGARRRRHRRPGRVHRAAGLGRRRGRRRRRVPGSARTTRRGRRATRRTRCGSIGSSRCCTG